jgi:HEAT repeat protein
MTIYHCRNVCQTAIMLLLAVGPSLPYGMEAQSAAQPVVDPFAALHDCATVRIVVVQTYQETYHGNTLMEVTLPFGESARALFAGAGLKPVDTEDADIVVTIRATGEAKATTGSPPVFYPWAQVTGTVAIKARGALVIEERFDGSSPGLLVGTPLYEWQKKPQSAPFMQAFVGDARFVKKNNETYLATILRLVARIYGPGALAGAMGEYRKIKWRGQDGIPLLTRILAETKDPAAVPPLIELLKVPGAQQMAAKQLGEMREPRAVDGLIALLSDTDTLTRSAAARALGQIGDARAIQPLIENLKDPEKGVGDAAEALVEFKDARVADALISGLKGNRDVRTGSARALRVLVDPRTVEPLIAALSDHDDWVKAEIAETLGAMPDPRSVEPMWTVLNEMKDWQSSIKVLSSLGEILRRYPDTNAVGPLMLMFDQKKDSSVREKIIQAIAPILDKRVLEFLMNCLKDSNYGVRNAAAAALSESQDPRAVDMLLVALQEPATRRDALKALGGFSQPRVSKALLAAMADPDEFVQQEAAISLGKIKDPTTIPPLIELLRQKEGYGNAARALHEITGKDFGVDYKKWSRWWKQEGSKGK